MWSELYFSTSDCLQLKLDTKILNLSSLEANSTPNYLSTDLNRQFVIAQGRWTQVWPLNFMPGLALLLVVGAFHLPLLAYLFN